MLGEMGSLSKEKHQGNAHNWDLFRAKKKVEEGLMREMMKLLRSRVYKGEDALKADMKRQRVEHQKRAIIWNMMKWSLARTSS